jgi:phosphopantetheinyl transferase (holo-ACP synthase)
MRLDACDLERRLAGFARVRVAVAIGQEGGESTLGRAALDALRNRLGDASGPPPAFPHARYSLSHSRGTAVAIGLLDAAPRGIGIDLEWRRRVPAGVERFYLSDRERRRLAGASRLGLWTLKEALFKADLANGSTRLHHYELCTADPLRGLGVSRSGALFRYASLEIEGGFLSVAVAL